MQKLISLLSILFGLSWLFAAQSHAQSQSQAFPGAFGDYLSAERILGDNQQLGYGKYYPHNVLTLSDEPGVPMYALPMNKVEYEHDNYSHFGGHYEETSKPEGLRLFTQYGVMDFDLKSPPKKDGKYDFYFLELSSSKLSAAEQRHRRISLAQNTQTGQWSIARLPDHLAATVVEGHGPKIDDYPRQTFAKYTFVERVLSQIHELGELKHEKGTRLVYPRDYARAGLYARRPRPEPRKVAYDNLPQLQKAVATLEALAKSKNPELKAAAEKALAAVKIQLPVSFQGGAGPSPSIAESERHSEDKP